MNALVDGTEVVIKDPPGFTYSLYDHIDLGKVKGNSSTDIDIVATNSARVALGSENMTESPTKRTKVMSMGELGSTYWRGDIRVEEWSRDVIKATSVGGNGAWIDKVKEKRLNDVSLPESPAIDAAYIASTWTNREDVLYFPLIDYGSFTDRISTYNVPALALRPGIRLGAFLVKAFEEVGYTLKAVGRFASIFPKLICPNTNENINASEAMRLGFRSVFSLQATFVKLLDVGNLNYQGPCTDTVDSDPGSCATAPDIYTAPYDMTVRVRIRGNGLLTGPTSGPEVWPAFWAVRDTITLDILSLASTQVSRTTGTTYSDEFPVMSFTMTAGQSVNLSLGVAVNIGTQLDVELRNMVVTYEVEAIPYQEGIRIDPGTAAPDLTVADALKSLVSIFNLAVVTNDVYGTVELSYFDDFLLPEADGVDWRGKENHNDEPKKVEPPIPLSYQMRYDEDDNDADLVLNNFRKPYPGYGNGDFLLSNGYDKPKKVEVKFAPTAMGTTFEGPFIPLMRKEDGEFQVSNYDYKPRILVEDGLSTGAWTYDGVAQTEYPNCYFVKPNQRYSLAFDTDTTYGLAAPGTIEQYYRNRLQRINDSFILEMDVRLWDDELQTMDFRKPVYLSDGYTDGWYYILKIDQKRFGVDEYTAVELLRI